MRRGRGSAWCLFRTRHGLLALLASATHEGSDTVENNSLDHSKHTFFEILSKTTVLFENTLDFGGFTDFSGLFGVRKPRRPNQLPVEAVLQPPQQPLARFREDLG